jgi:hypothetical protein
LGGIAFYGKPFHQRDAEGGGFSRAGSGFGDQMAFIG